MDSDGCAVLAFGLGRYDRAHLEHCIELAVLMLDGWRQSISVASEIDVAKELDKPVRQIEPARVGITERFKSSRKAGGC